MTAIPSVAGYSIVELTVFRVTCDQCGRFGYTDDAVAWAQDHYDDRHRPLRRLVHLNGEWCERETCKRVHEVCVISRDEARLP